MNLQDFKTTLQELSAAESIALDTDLIGEDIGNLLNACFGIPANETLSIDEPTITSQSQQVLLTGTASFLDITAEVQLTFEDDAQHNLQLQLIANLPPDWTFSQSFPDLAEYYNFSSPDGGYRESYLNELAFSSPQLILTTVDYEDLQTSVAFERGLNFVASLNLLGLLEPLVALAGSQSPILMSGLLTDGTTKGDFALSAPFPLSLGSESFGFQRPTLKFRSSFTGITEDATAAIVPATPQTPAEILQDVAPIEISVALKLANKTIELFSPIRLGMSALDFFVLGARLTNFTLPSLGDMASFVGGADLEGVLPGSLQSFGGLTIAQFAVGFSIKQRTLNYVTFDLLSTSQWVILDDVLSIESLAINWLVNSPLRAAQRQTACTIGGQLKIGENCLLNLAAQTPNFVISGSLAEGSSLRLGELIGQFASAPSLDDRLVISQLDFQAQPAFKTFSFAAQIDQVLEIDFFGDKKFAIRSLFFSLDRSPGSTPAKPNTAIVLAGELTLFDFNMLISAETPGSGQGWLFQGQLAPNDKVSLPRLVADFIAAADGTTIDLPASLQDINLSALAFSISTDATKAYSFAGALRWKIDLGTGGTISIQAAVAVNSKLALAIGGTLPATPRRRETSGKISGKVSLNIDAEFFKNFAIEASYAFEPSRINATNGRLEPGAKRLELTITKLIRSRTLIFKAEISLGGTQATILQFGFDGNSTFGDLLAFMVQLVDPDVEEFTLDPPWDALDKIDLSDLTLTINLTKKEAGVIFQAGFKIEPFVDITDIRLRYARNAAGKGTVLIDLIGTFINNRYTEDKPLGWDAMNQSPPVVPGQGNGIFDLQYLGVGQHVAFRSVAEFENITQVMTTLRQSLLTPEDSRSNPLLAATALAFSSESGWLIGAQFSLIDTLDLSLIFNDPIIYGIRIGLRGAKAQMFAGLIFEILYRRISDTIGVYHIELVLPDAMRQLQFGAVAVTLPGIVLDIYTNGDFKIDLGFPWGMNFARSFAIDVLIFTGGGGFYFNKLSAETATSVPYITNGKFNPVIEFGLGLKVGVGRTFNKGPLKAEISITVQGIIQGVIAWFNPSSPAVKTDQYYKIQGGVAIVGRLYGIVDFVVIQVEVEVLIRVAVLFVVEAYQPIRLAIVAEVSVRASIKIVFVTINFSFNLTVRQEFVLGSAKPTPWIVGQKPATRTAMAASVARMATFALSRDIVNFTMQRRVPPLPLNWTPISVWNDNAKKTLDVFFQPTASRTTADIQAVALLFIENCINVKSQGAETYNADAAADTKDFDRLVQALLIWALHAYYQPPATDAPESETFTFGEVYFRKGDLLRDLRQLYEMFTAGEQDATAAFNFDNLIAFLQQNFVFNVTDCIKDTSGTIFPMFPQFAIATGEQSSTTLEFKTFDSQALLSPVDRQRLRKYFKALKLDQSNPVNETGETLSAAKFIFMDYFALLMRGGIQAAIDFLDDPNLAATQLSLANVLDALDRGGPFNHLAGMASRFLLHGLRLPLNPLSDTDTTPLYVATGQQVSLPAALTDTFALTLRKPPTLTGITFPDSRKDPNSNRSEISNANTLQFTLGNEPPTSGTLRKLITLINQLRRTDITLPAEPPTLLPFYNDVPHRFNLQQKIDWMATIASTDRLATLASIASTEPTITTEIPILALPETLLAYVQAQGSSGTELTLKRGRTEGNRRELISEDISTYTWATKLNVSVQHELDASGTPLPLIYRLSGINESGKNLLELLLSHLATTNSVPQLYLLHAVSDGSTDDRGLMNRSLTDQLLLKTNLATESNPSTVQIQSGSTDTLFSAKLSDGTNFLRLLWEASTVNSGGYFLNYSFNDGGLKGLPDGLFANDRSASLVLLIVLPDSTAATQTAHRFHNCAIVRNTINLEAEVIYAESDESVQALSIPAGHLGFKLTLPRPVDVVLSTPPKADEERKQAESQLRQLYHLLGFNLVESKAFKGSPEGLPIGPADDDPTTRTDDHVWIYERVVPIFPFAQTSAKTSDTTNALLLAAKSPYAGISDTAQTTIEFYWQDVYGNRFNESRLTRSLDVRYFDPLLSLNQWSTVAESYTFSAIDGDSSHVSLNLELAFDQTPYIPAPGKPLAQTQDATRNARSMYQQVYYQICQDVTFTLHTSVLTNTSTDVEKQFLIAFVESAYQYLTTIDQFQAVTHTVKTETLSNLSSAYHVSIKDLAETNQRTRHFFAAGRLRVPLEYTIQETDQKRDTFASIAHQFTTNTEQFKQYLTLLTAANAQTPGLFNADVIIQISGKPYIVQVNDSLTTIAIVTNTPIADVMTAIQGMIGLLVKNAVLTIASDPSYAIDYIKTEKDYSLESIAQAMLTQPVTMPDNVRVNPALLTIATIAAANSDVALNPAMKPPVDDSSGHTTIPVTIPHRVTIASPLLLPIPADKTLAEIIANLNLPHGVAEVAIANQSRIGLLANGIKVPIVTAAVLSQRSSPNLNAQDWQAIINANVTTHTNETLTTLAIRLSEILKRSTLQPINQLLATLTLLAQAQPGTLQDLMGTTIDQLQHLQTQPDLAIAAIAKQLTEDLRTAAQSNATASEIAVLANQFLTESKQIALQRSTIADRPVSIADVAAAIADIPNLFVAGKGLIQPPIAASTSIQLPLFDAANNFRYPTAPIFPVTVQIDMTRNAKLVYSRDVPPEAQKVTAYLTPKTLQLTAGVVGETAEAASLRQFAQHFEAAFTRNLAGKGLCGLHLAVGNNPETNPDNPSTSSNKALWAVHLGKTGIDYNINETMPFFFSPAPLANTLLAGTIEVNRYISGQPMGDETDSKRVDAIDLNVLARDFLVAVEAFLEPAIAIPAYKLSDASAANVTNILQYKQRLATAISKQVTNILAQTTAIDISQRLAVAKETLRQQLLVNLVEAFDIETIIQYNVDVAVANNPGWTYRNAPRLVGQPVVVNADPSTLPPFTLSSAKVPLAPLEHQASYLTFFFDTRSPEKLEDLALNLTYRVNEIEYNLTNVPGIANYQASDWLSFILPIDSLDPTASNPAANPNYIGTVKIPIPLRTYPIPPSLVLQQAEIDPDAQTQLDHIREWAYKYTYEHLDVAQDAIESNIYYNTATLPPETQTSSTTQQILFAALVNFSLVYPQLTADLQRLTGSNPQANLINPAIAALENLIDRVTTAWESWQADSTRSQPRDVHYTIEEVIRETRKDITVAITSPNALPTLPKISVPKFKLDRATGQTASKITYEFLPKSIEEAALDPVFGESSIPDRTIILENLDIIAQQSAWGAIWLTRNQALVQGMTTNPAFVFQTPAVRFSNPLTPLLVNTQIWDIATIGTTRQLRLEQHLQNLFTVLLPQQSTQPYALRLACHYAFALVEADGTDEDLLSTLPVLLTPQFRVEANQSMLETTQPLRSHLAQDMQAWQTQFKPVQAKGKYRFSVSLFSAIATAQASVNLPLLKLDDLELHLQDVL